MITQRDLKLLELLTSIRFMTVKQIQDTIFSRKSPSICYKRLDHLIKCKMINRKYYNLGEKSNAYVYFLDKAPKKKNLKHELLMSQFVTELIKQGYEILEIEKTPIYKGFIPDAIIKFRKKDGSIKHLFLEVQLSKHSIYEKYYNINPDKDPSIPNILYVITDKPQENHQIRNLRIVVDDLEMHKLQFYFS